MRRALLAGLITSLVAACVEPAAPAATSGPTTSFSSATADDATGGLEGLIVDDEARGVVQAEVSLMPGELTTVTDPQGRFSFSKLEAGSYVVNAGRLGYESAARRVDVRVGEVSWANLTLLAIVIAESGVELRILNGFIKYGNAGSDVFTTGNAYGCEKCRFNFTFDGTQAQAGVLEPLFTSSMSPPHDPMRLGFQGGFQDELCVGDAVYSVPPDNDGYWASRQKIHADDCKFGAPKGTFYLIAYCDWDWVCVDQKFQVFVSVFHGMLPADEYTALPPP